MNLQLKLSRTKKLLKVWNREVFGNIIQNLKDAEQAVLEAQILYDSDPTPALRAEFSRVSAQLIITTKMEEEFWRQKRVKSRIHTIEFGGQALTEETEIRESAAAFFHQLRTSDVGDLAEPDLSLIHTLPDSVDQEALCSPPQEKEVRDAVFGISGDSVSGPDGFTLLFFQHCWDTVGRDVIGAVADFFSGAFMPQSFTATVIVLIPKKPNPSGFIKGCLLSDNALLAQELIHDLGKELSSRGRSPNLALKLDMAKAYDRVQWSFLLKVLEMMGFSTAWKVNNGKTHFFWRLSTWSLLALLRRLEAFSEK
ncbi:uncharacterized protein LOC121745917 [Salvia splendens]|uniref:uncharacterized protein LOC121745917 n=1 Tax=Salvia splendens TaxID=180675 RepID=UPI001C256786|nr:uncharacterized protein LOC121745917 [Salvia splendens]